MKKKDYFSNDTRELLYLLHMFRVKYLIVGGEAVIYYGHARLTGDIDIFYEKSPKNSKALYSVLKEFWSKKIPIIKSAEDLLKYNMIFQFGVPPNRIDLINNIENVKFKESWENRTRTYTSYNNRRFIIYYIGIEQLIKNKKAVGRFRDKDDLEFLVAALKTRKNRK